MDMQLDQNRIRTERERRAWSQEHLAEVAGLSLRTIQRVETTGSASFETARALAAVIEVEVASLSSAPSPSAPRRGHDGAISDWPPRWLWHSACFSCGMRMRAKSCSTWA